MVRVASIVVLMTYFCFYVSVFAQSRMQRTCCSVWNKIKTVNWWIQSVSRWSPRDRSLRTQVQIIRTPHCEVCKWQWTTYFYKLHQHNHSYSNSKILFTFNSCAIIVFSDYRLNPVLRKACKADIPKFCQSILNKASDANELEGQVISCLKLKYADQVCVCLCHWISASHTCFIGIM